MTLARAATLPVVMELLDEPDGASTHTQRHLLSLLSRFFGWLIERGLASFNPVKMIPQGSRPEPGHKKNAPWLRDEALMVKVMEALPEPVSLMFYLANRCGGLRLGEVAGLRMRDMDRLKDGLLVVGKSYGSFLNARLNHFSAAPTIK